MTFVYVRPRHGPLGRLLARGAKGGVGQGAPCHGVVTVGVILGVVHLMGQG